MTKSKLKKWLKQRVQIGIDIELNYMYKEELRKKLNDTSYMEKAVTETANKLIGVL